ncbi:MAG: carbamoyltransferase HypF [Saprospiraceae bacterium]|nr:carbamoyltransferase HypF [Saprospiraceae bacterium]
MLKTYHIHIQGQVQGVGFRPFVWRLAQEMGLHGWVNNAADGVHIEFNAAPHEAQVFFEKMQSEAPPLARIRRSEMVEAPPQFFEKFEIVESSASSEPDLPLTPDFALCETCAEDLRQPGNRRHRYAFTTCTTCGPRYSIIKRLPYDRAETAMQPFAMCTDCQQEYDDVTERRYFSQTNSCPVCGITLRLFSAHTTPQRTQRNDNQHVVSVESLCEIQNVAEGNKTLNRTVEALRQGNIVAAKGIGGYLLLCDASNRSALETLRQRKHRPSKPFALLYPSLEVLAKNAELSEAAMQELTSPVAPIVLLPLVETPVSIVAFDLVAPSLDKVGAMLPYSPLLRLLGDDFGGVLVATSGNLSGSPIVFEDKMALETLTAVADFVLTNDRDIVTPQDDSVLTFSPFHQQKIILRRSRGLAPSLFIEDLDLPSGNVLAMGASLKSTFCRQHRRNIYVSQYLGDLESYDTQQSFRHALDHLTAVLQTPPDTVLLDAHPDYFSTQLGEELAANWGAKTVRIQHHEAHFAAVLAENNLLRSTNPVLGIIWDGTGLGSDGQIWGGEFFLREKGQLQRIAHLDNFDFLLGDKMPREPRISALSLCNGIAEAESFLVTKFSPNEWSLYNRLLRNGSSLRTSSMGRLFDGVASLLGLGDAQSFEGEAAMQLEQAATRFFKKHGLRSAESWLERLDNQGNMPFSVILTGLLNGLKKGDSIEKLAAQFHVSLVYGIRLTTQHYSANKLAFSGGVWQNGLLVDLVIEHLGGDFELFFHRQVSPNDECVSFGQLIHHSSFIIHH